jgi:hypothetical protein
LLFQFDAHLEENRKVQAAKSLICNCEPTIRKSPFHLGKFDRQPSAKVPFHLR